MSNLYERLGGENAVNAAVELFYRKVLADGRIAQFFDGVDIDQQIAKQKSFLTMAFGGIQMITREPTCAMRISVSSRRASMISHVDAVIENLNYTLRDLGVPEKRG